MKKAKAVPINLFSCQVGKCFSLGKILIFINWEKYLSSYIDELKIELDMFLGCPCRQPYVCKEL